MPFEDVDKVVSMFLDFIFHAKVVDNQGKLDRLPVMRSEARDN